MNNILASATKIVFIMVALTLCIWFFLGRVDWKDFLILVSMVFAFYYGTKSVTPVDTSSTTNTKQPL